MNYTEDYTQFDAEADRLEELREEGKCVFDDDEECIVHHSYLHETTPNTICLWASQHHEE